MRKIFSLILACLLTILVHAQEHKAGAIIERYDASFTMASQTSGTYKVNMRVCILDKESVDEAVFLKK